ncbi:MAG: 5'/3'-nucleotidase SurE [Dehalococcoidales bacterium]|jgi:5'-nucleotidase|nr:5'/3'-nucleotidase SurE [Dehalococcoidales bacterium]
MAILVTNDDGIFAPGLRVLVKELQSTIPVITVAPDREQSATGTAVTLRQPLRVQRISPIVPNVDTYSVEGTPSDSVILALGKLVESKIEMVISGINRGPNLGDDVLISGTVSAALQGYLRGLPAFAISTAGTDSHHLDNAAKLAVLLAKNILTGTLPMDVFLNVNLPALPLTEIKGLKITRLAHKTHIDTVKEGHDGRREYYWLVRQKLSTSTDTDTDIRTLEQGNISITALHTALFQRPTPGITDSLCSDLFRELKQACHLLTN